MENKLMIIAILFIATLIGCENKETKTGDDETKIMVHKNFIHPDSLEVSVEQFLIVACDKRLKNIEVIEYLDRAAIGYRLFDNSGGFKWYDVYANHKEYHVGFAEGRMFSYME